LSISSATPGKIIKFGKLQGVDTSGTSVLNADAPTAWVAGDDLYLSTTPGKLTVNRPTGGATAIQRVAKVLRVDATGGQLLVFNTNRTAGLPNLTQGKIWQGDVNGHPVEVDPPGGVTATVVLTENEFYRNLAGTGTLGSHRYMSFAGTGAADNGGCKFVIPADYGSGLNFRIVWIMDGSGTDDVKFFFNLIQSGDLETADNTTPTEVLSVIDTAQATTPWLNQITGSVASALTWVPGEVCFIEVERDPGDAEDTSNDTAYLSCVIIEYTKA
jgi:hypothetical protein